MKKRSFIWYLCLMMMVFLLAGCSNQSVKETVSKDNTEQSLTNEEKTVSENREKLSMEEIELLAAERAFNIHWYTQDGDYSAGTGFVMDSSKHGQKLLVTAFHFLWPDDAETFSGEELPEFVQGGEIFCAYNDEATNAYLKNCLVIKDADAVPEVDKDVAAFTIQGGEQLKTLPLAATMPKKGDVIYLLADLWNSDVIHENCVYPGKVTDVDGGVLYYTLDGKPGTQGASGGPVINEYGEVVAMHMASNPICFLGHMADSFGKQIDAATISDIAYPEMKSDKEDTQTEAGYGDVEEYLYDEKVSSMFYDIQINGVTYTDTLGEETCNEGYEFVILDVSLWAAAEMPEPINMYYSDFAIEWMESYCEPLQTGLMEGQLPDEYTITTKETKGKLVFCVPENQEILALSFVDYYYMDDEEDAEYGTYYIVYLPNNDWSR